jgi:hypothetical protein
VELTIEGDRVSAAGQHADHGDRLFHRADGLRRRTASDAEFGDVVPQTTGADAQDDPPTGQRRERGDRSASIGAGRLGVLVTFTAPAIVVVLPRTTPSAA